MKMKITTSVELTEEQKGKLRNFMVATLVKEVFERLILPQVDEMSFREILLRSREENTRILLEKLLGEFCGKKKEKTSNEAESEAKTEVREEEAKERKERSKGKSLEDFIE